MLEDTSTIVQTKGAAESTGTKGVAFRDTLLKMFDIFRYYARNSQYYREIVLLSRFPTAQANRCLTVNDVNKGSPSRMRRVRRISFGMTILPRSSTRRTIRCCFHCFSSPCAAFPVVLFAGNGGLCDFSWNRKTRIPFLRSWNNGFSFYP